MTDFQHDINIDQTFFQEDLSAIEQRSQEEKTPTDKVRPIKKSNIPLIASFALGTMFILLIVSYVLSSTSKSITETAQPTQTPTSQQVQESDIEKEMRLIESLIEDADPTNNTLPLPPISYEFSIGKSE